MAALPWLQEGEPGHGVAHDGHKQWQQPQGGEEERGEGVQPVACAHHPEETPASRALYLVGPVEQEWQQGHKEGQEPNGRHKCLHVARGDDSRVEERVGHPKVALHGHRTPQEQRAQAKEDHGGTEDSTQNALGVEGLPVLAVAIDIEHKGAVDEVAQTVCDNQTAGKEQEAGLRLEAETLVGLDQDEEGESIGEDAHRHGYDRGNDRDLRLASGTIWWATTWKAASLWTPILGHS